MSELHPIAQLCSENATTKSDWQFSFGDPLDHAGVTMVKEVAHPSAQLRNCTHFFVSENEVEHIEIHDNPLFVGGLRDCDDPTLDEPPQDHLRDRLSVRARDR